MLRGSDRAAQENYIRDEYTLEFLGALNLNPRSLFSLWTLSAINKKGTKNKGKIIKSSHKKRTKNEGKITKSSLKKEQRTREN